MPNRLWKSNPLQGLEAKTGKIKPFDTEGDEVKKGPFCRPSGRAFAGDEVVGRPRPAHDDFHSGEMTCSHLVAILVFLNLFVVDKVGDVNQHATGVNFAAADVLVERGKNLVDLNRKGARLGLSLALPDGLFPQFAQIFAAHRSGKFNFFQSFAQRTVLDE